MLPDQIPDFGLTVVCDPPDAILELGPPTRFCDPSLTIPFSIVLVHGLNGNPRTTWLHGQSNVFWPVDLLSRKVPDARVFVFGYDTNFGDFFHPASGNRIEEHAQSLNTSLANRREQTESVRLFQLPRSL